MADERIVVTAKAALNAACHKRVPEDAVAVMVTAIEPLIETDLLSRLTSAIDSLPTREDSGLWVAHGDVMAVLKGGKT